jgi:hypothetical protein
VKIGWVVNLQQNKRFFVVIERVRFGPASALCQAMMQAPSEKFECEPVMLRSRQQVAQMLEELRAAYQALPLAERAVVKFAITQPAARGWAAAEQERQQ